MVWVFVTWLVAFFLLMALFGRSMFSMICLEDLSQDLINPFDLATKFNRFVILEQVGQLAITCILLFTGMWFSGLIQLVALGLLVRLHMRKQVYIDATDVFRQLPQLKFRKTFVFCINSAGFLIATFRVIEAGIHAFLTPEGKEAAKKLFQEAAASHHTF
eukprot:gene4659-14856_t